VAGPGFCLPGCPLVFSEILPPACPFLKGQKFSKRRKEN